MENEMKTPKNGEELRKLSRKNPSLAFKFLSNNNDAWNEIAKNDPFDSADTLEEFEPEEAGGLLLSLPVDISIKIFESLRPRAIIEIVQNLSSDIVEQIFSEMDTEDVVDVFERSTVDEAEDLLEILNKSTKLVINKRLAYPRNSVGRLMSEEVAKISTGLTVKEALEELKSLHTSVEDIVYVYSVDKNNILSGVLSFREIVFANESELIENVMICNPIYINPSKSIKLRLPWIAVNMGLAFIVSWLIAQFDETIANDALLAALMPVVALVGGNSGAQSLAIVIRALARNDISDARVMEVIGKQSLIGIINGIFIGLFSFILLTVSGLNSYSLALSISVFGNIFIGNLFGSSIPLILKKLGFDPALASNIFLTLITDIVGFAGFLGIALLLI